MNDVMSTGTWVSTTDLAGLAKWLADCRRVVVVTHVKPDGDAVGATLALVRALNLADPFASARRGEPRAEAWYFGPLPPWLKDVARETAYRVIEKDGPPAHADPDAVMVLDTGSWIQLEAVQDWLRARGDRTAVIDHHVHGDSDVAALRVVDTAAAAVCQPVAQLCRLVLGVQALARLPQAVATPLYLGLATDTGWFRHSNVNHAVMNTAGELLDARAENTWLYQVVEQRETPSRLRLLARALASLELAPIDARGNNAAFLTLRKSDFAECAAEPGESGGFVDYGQAIPSVQVTVLLTEATAGEYGQSRSDAPLTKLSLRSKPGEHAVDVNAVANRLGGGGHVRAAGARVPQTIENARTLVLEAIRAEAGRPGAS